MPLVSVVIAARDSADYIADAIKSTLGQSLTDLECIVVDDGSVDDTASIVLSIMHDDSRLRLYRVKESRGVSAARNLAIAQASGEWVAVLDSDDRFDLDRLNLLTKAGEAFRLDMVADNLSLLSFPSGEQVGSAFPSQWMGSGSLVDLEDYLKRDQPGTGYKMFGFCKPLIRRGFLVSNGLSYDEETWCGEDSRLYMECLLKGARFGCLEFPLYLYHVRAGSASSSRPAVFRESTRMNHELLHKILLMRPDLSKVARDRILALDWQYFIKSAQGRDLKNASEALARLPPGFVAAKIASKLTRRFTR